MGSKTDARNLVGGPAICLGQLVANGAEAHPHYGTAPLINELREERRVSHRLEAKPRRKHSEFSRKEEKRRSSATGLSRAEMYSEEGSRSERIPSPGKIRTYTCAAGLHPVDSVSPRRIGVLKDATHDLKMTYLRD